jgi:NADPH-dependent 2,4-dienoyl-CoA reductase/sulfur reductase-like enzyme/nitrite reductase/ring-hydroxylating ferredoxin subunit
MSETSDDIGPDLEKVGVAESELAEGAMLVGHVGGDKVLLARTGARVLAVDATCTHYGGPLFEGLLVGGTVRCPWHHACFELATGEALRAPALTPLSCWRVEQSNGRIYVRGRQPAPAPGGARRAAQAAAGPIVIVGGGAAGFAAAEMLRREGFGGEVILLSADEEPPYDRPNLSKDYLAGTAPEDWIALRPPSFYSANAIELRLATRARGIDLPSRRVLLENGGSVRFAQLLLATGAEPIRLGIRGADLPHVHTLRSLGDCRRIIERAKRSRRVVIVGASFIGLEAAAALRQRKLEVHVVAPEPRPMERVLGPALGDFVRALHESHGVQFHLGRMLTTIESKDVRLDSGSQLSADLVLIGIGVRPRVELAEGAGLAIDRGVLVNEYLETSAAGVYAAGDIARWPDAASGERLRIEHWVVAERQGQTAARNMLGMRERFAAVPFFWTQHYDVSIDYLGHAAAWDEIGLDGDIAARDAALRFRKGGRTLAVASIFRGQESLRAELAMEQGRSP